MSFFSIDHSSKTINIYQATSKRLKDHAFKVSTVKELFDRINLSKSGYKAALYLFIPNSEKTQCGSAFNVTLDAKKPVLKTLAEVKAIAKKQQEDGVPKNCTDCRHMLLLDTYIIRFPYYLQRKKFILPRKWNSDNVKCNEFNIGKVW